MSMVEKPDDKFLRIILCGGFVHAHTGILDMLFGSPLAWPMWGKVIGFSSLVALILYTWCNTRTYFRAALNEGEGA